MAKKKKFNSNIFIYIFMAVLIGVGIYFSATSFNVLQTEKTFFEGLTCEQPTDCYDKLIDEGFPKEDLDEQLLEYELICENNECGVTLK